MTSGVLTVGIGSYLIPPNEIFEIGETICNASTIAQIREREFSPTKVSYMIDLLLSRGGTFYEQYTRGEYTVESNLSGTNREINLIHSNGMATCDDFDQDEIFYSYDKMPIEEKLCHANTDVRCAGRFQHSPQQAIHQVRQMLEQLIRRENDNVPPSSSVRI